ncbi:MAG: HAD family hydrolase [Rhodobacterales bacterium]|nr:MAG: HAD family hydrolase [Rhodobacterales bacterium]
MRDLKLVLFDVDGTLLDSQNFIIQAVRNCFVSMGRAVPKRADIRAIVGLSLEAAMAQLAPDLTGAQNTEAARALKESFLSLRAKTGGEASMPTYPGTREMLDRLGAVDEIFLGIATNKARLGVDHFLESHGLTGRFHTIQTVDNHPGKPHPAMAEAALSELGIDKRNAVLVGDTTFDMQLAHNAGIGAIGVDWGYHTAADLREAGASHVLTSFAGLDAVLDEIWGTV